GGGGVAAATGVLRWRVACCGGGFRQSKSYYPSGTSPRYMADRYLEVVEPEDNVATALRDVEAGETVTVAVGDEQREIEVVDDVQFGHKLAVTDLSDGDTIRKYGKSIGNATEDIPAGTWVHVHNVESNYGRGDLAADGEGGGDAAASAGGD
ncbi:MAG: UxaA family hydrolase, partial [Halobaculum sp.]